MKPLCLDIGNVLGLVHFDEFVTSVSAFTNTRQIEAQERINLYQGLHDTGLITMKEILTKEFGIKSETVRAEIISNWLDILTLDYHIISEFDQLSEDNCIDVALLSNIGYEHSMWVDQQLNYFDNKPFSDAVKHYSCRVGARKPSKLYYLSFLQIHPQFKGAVYVDDNIDNLNASKEFGFITVRLDLLNMDKEEVEDKLALIKRLVSDV